MKTEVSSDEPIAQTTLEFVTGHVDDALRRFGERLTRAEVHLRLKPGHSHAAGVDCRLEVRPAGRDPVTVSDHAPRLEDAVRGAAGKMERLLTSTFGKAESHKGGPSASGLPT